VLAALIDALGGRTMRDRLRRSISQPGADETAHGEHLSILAALTAHDPERTRTRMSAHLFTVEDYLHDRPTADGTLTERPDGRWTTRIAGSDRRTTQKDDSAPMKSTGVARDTPRTRTHRRPDPWP